MAFNRNFLARVSTSGNNEAGAVWSYKSTTDDIATITASAYFNNAQAVSGQDNGPIKVGDKMMITGSDASGMYIVTAVSPNVTVATFAAASAIDTAQIVDNAVTAAKLASDSVETAKILDANVTLAKLASAIAPSHVVKFAGQHTTAGGSAAEAITVSGALATDLAFVQLVDAGSNTVSVVQAQVTADTLTVTFSADPGADAIINYQLLRAV